jgi:hypothetical protein
LAISSPSSPAAALLFSSWKKGASSAANSGRAAAPAEPVSRNRSHAGDEWNHVAGAAGSGGRGTSAAGCCCSTSAARADTARRLRGAARRRAAYMVRRRRLGSWVLRGRVWNGLWLIGAAARDGDIFCRHVSRLRMGPTPGGKRANRSRSVCVLIGPFGSVCVTWSQNVW